jgi:dienelactone hydrolase
MGRVRWIVWLRGIVVVILGLVVLILVAGLAGYLYFSRHGGTDVREAGLIGRFYAPTGVKHRTAVLILGGSNGGFPYDSAAQDLSNAGYPTFAVAYFKNFMKQPDGVPGHLSNIPLEYFFHAIDWMKKRPEVNPGKIVLMGESRGGELVLLLASLRPDIAGVIVYSPSNVVWAGIESPWNKPAWTLQEKPIAFLTSTYTQGDGLLHMFKTALAKATPQQLAAAAIPVENIHGPVLLISSKSDKLWPSSEMADNVEARLTAHHFGYSVQNLQFSDSSHLLMGYGPGIVKMGIPFLFQMNFGGSKEGTRKARDAGWAAAKAFLRRVDNSAENRRIDR